MSLIARCTCDHRMGMVWGDYSKSCPRHGSSARWLERQLAERAAQLAALRVQALTRPAHGGYPDAPSGVEGKT